MLFGIASAPAVFQKTMDTILQGMEGVICYLNDILIMGKTKTEQLKNLKKVLQQLMEYCLRIKKSKCAFNNPSVQYLGHIIDADCLHATDNKIKVITEATVPSK